MPIADSLKAIQVVTDQAGHPTGVLLDIQTWESLLAWIEDATDAQLAANALRELTAAGDNTSKAGWVPWESARGEWLRSDGPASDSRP